MGFCFKSLSSQVFLRGSEQMVINGPILQSGFTTVYGATTERLRTTLPTVLGPLNKKLVGKRFAADVDVKRAVAYWLQTLNTDVFYVGIQAVLPWCDTCLNVNDIYVEVRCVPCINHAPCIHGSRNKDERFTLFSGTSLRKDRAERPSKNPFSAHSDTNYI